jgi:hypothetical protein
MEMFSEAVMPLVPVPGARYPVPVTSQLAAFSSSLRAHN